jgi:hypothetical protein
MEVVVVDSTGRLRPDWAAAFHQRPLPVRPLRAQKARDGVLSELVSRLEGHLDPTRDPHLVAEIVVRPQ